MSDHRGDDLIAARRFTDLCQLNMSEIFSGKALTISDVMTRLGEIQSHAKLMHARSIYRSAQRVVEDLTIHKSAQDSVSSVLNLQKLIRQYEAGLSEIAPKTVRKTILSKTAQSPANAGPAIVSDMSRQTEAAKILGPLISFAGDEDQKGLVRLLSLAANDTPRQHKAAQRHFDLIMPDLTNHWLRLARANDKNISVSVSAEDVLVDVEILRILQTHLSELGSTLVLNCVEDPKARAEKSMSQSAHLAVTTQTENESIDILLSCEGLLSEGLKFDHLKAAIVKLGGKFSITQSKGVIRAEIHKIPSHRGAQNSDLVQEVAS